MARIPDSEIERLKSEVSVERLIESAGIALAKSGKDRIGRCPFHADDTASLVVTPAQFFPVLCCPLLSRRRGDEL